MPPAAIPVLMEISPFVSSTSDSTITVGGMPSSFFAALMSILEVLRLLASWTRQYQHLRLFLRRSKSSCQHQLDLLCPLAPASPTPSSKPCRHPGAGLRPSHHPSHRPRQRSLWYENLAAAAFRSGPSGRTLPLTRPISRIASPALSEGILPFLVPLFTLLRALIRSLLRRPQSVMALLESPCQRTRLQKRASPPTTTLTTLLGSPECRSLLQ